MVAETVAQLGGLHIAVNNAGINRSGPGEATSEDDWNDTFAVNSTGVFLCCQVINDYSSCKLSCIMWGPEVPALKMLAYGQTDCEWHSI